MVYPFRIAPSVISTVNVEGYKCQSRLSTLRGSKQDDLIRLRLSMSE